ncbi:pyridoxal phosphate-dependent aminotransferase [Methylophaga pinxianii]|uniref:pyridoxal phosphate-dependent aminotransferase n=1 Tax=Methylophaga pinxianii TaxID=2881052 RepID=UPI001CF39D4F|nr:pyridoxal phosphate-dependent aminotransferase [Methylophaga pinxianii]MCB2427871.1 pyridoxal phosphate-dependent aminotransferase [Methylophaga pinxianii]UPH44661.1 pyridoxal phosphate-dependent aminotransferase [Methylophaga pinxianii]
MPKLIDVTQRAQGIKPFQVMDILSQGKILQAQGRDIIHLEIGEPDFLTPQPIIDAAVASLNNGDTFYTPSLGLMALREKIAGWYYQQYGLSISPCRIVITPGASGALLLVMGALLEAGKHLLMTDPGYPCNRHFARFVEASAVSVPVGAETAYQLSPEHIEKYWNQDTQMALVASPSNPTGTIIDKNGLKALSAAIKSKQGILVVDEIYHGLNYDGIHLPTILEVDDDAIVINSFSKFFGMTGWRLGWSVVPESLEPVMDRLAQNLFLAAPTTAQYAALTAFDRDSMEILEQRRQVFEQRRDILLPALQSIGFSIPVKPQGAFYLYADCSRFLNERITDGLALSQYLLKEAGVAITPGNDFGVHLADQHVRFAYTTDQERLLQAVERIQSVLNKF